MQDKFLSFFFSNRLHAQWATIHRRVVCLVIINELSEATFMQFMKLVAFELNNFVTVFHFIRTNRTNHTCKLLASECLVDGTTEPTCLPLQIALIRCVCCSFSFSDRVAAHESETAIEL